MADAEMEELKKLQKELKVLKGRFDNGEKITDEELGKFIIDSETTIEEFREELKGDMSDILEIDFEEMEEAVKKAEEERAKMSPQELAEKGIDMKMYMAAGQKLEPPLEDFELYAKVNKCSVDEAKETYEDLVFSLKPREPREDEADFDSMSDKEEDQYWKDEFKRREKLWEKDVLTDNDIHDLCEMNSCTRKEVLETHENYTPDTKSGTNNLGLLGTIIKIIKSLFK